jgi:hypothetical protein
MRPFFGSVLLVCFLFAPAVSSAQTSDTGTISGSVRDASGGVLPGVDVEVADDGTKFVRTAVTSLQGQYVFTAVPPGNYQITLRLSGFRTTLLKVRVEAARTTSGNAVLEVGELSETVEVVAGAREELQTINATIGDVITTESFNFLPTVQRRADELVYLQVATTPKAGLGNAGGSVAGGRTDQNSATLDGITITDLTEGGVYTSGSISQLSLPVEAIQEFRASVSNPNEAQSGSGGGQFAFTTKRGNNDWHGSTYWYHQNDKLNANSWTRNQLGQENPELRDNRAGFTFSGPIARDKLWFFAFYEGRRFPQGVDATRIGITETYRRGVLTFADATGVARQYNLNPANGPLAATCGSAGNLPCDPRGIGMSPVIQQYFQLYPVANAPADGDGFNTSGIRDAVDTNSKFDNSLGRLDYRVSNQWSAFGTWFRQRQDIRDTTQLDFNPAVTKGKLLVSTSGLPHAPDVTTLGLNGQLTGNLNYSFRYGYNIQGFKFDRKLPQADLVPGVPGFALDLGIIDDPSDPVVVRARPEGSDTRLHQVNNTFAWVKGNHVLNMGASYRYVDVSHVRVDKIPAHMIPIARITAGEFTSVPNAQRPPICGGAIQTNCLRPGDVSRWDTLYSALLGVWDNTQSFNGRDAQGNLLGRELPGISYRQTFHHSELQFSDAWSVGPSLTVNLGVNVTYETPYKEVDGKDYFIVDADTGELIKPKEVLRKKFEAAEQGQIFNQRVAWVGPNEVGQGLYKPLFNGGPRAAVAWNPAFTAGFLGKVLGDRRTVFRGGYSYMFDQILAITPQLWGMIGNERLGDSATITAPTCDREGTPGPNCTPDAAFRIGVDGHPTIPAATVQPARVIPVARNTLVPNSGFGITTATAMDPDFKVGRIHGANFTVQRALPAGVIAEFGWIGRWGRDQMNSLNLNAPPINLKDMTGLSNQRFAEAFDAVAAQLRAGVAPAAVTPQPWFENLFGAGGTTVIATSNRADFVNNSLVNLFSGPNGIDARQQRAGRPTVMNQQFRDGRFLTFGSKTNYQAFFTSVRKNLSHGLTLAGNWTWSHCLDSGGQIQDNAGGAWPNPYDEATAWGDCVTDIRHVVQSYGTYIVPNLTESRAAAKILNGWYASWVFTARTGVPLTVTQGGQPFGGGGLLSAPIVGDIPKLEVHRGVNGSGGVGTSSGTGLNAFADPEAVFRQFRFSRLTEDAGHSNRRVHGFGRWNVDISVGKEMRVSDRLRGRFGFDVFNVFNHVTFNNPTLNLTNPASFGVVTSAESGGGDSFVGPRRIQFFLRLDL